MDAMTTLSNRIYLYLDSIKVLAGYCLFFAFVLTILYRSAVYLGSPTSLLLHLLLVYAFLLYKGFPPRNGSYFLIPWIAFWLAFVIPIFAAFIALLLKTIGVLSGSRAIREYAQMAFGLHDLLDGIFRLPWH